MFCHKCGASIQENSHYCSKCGAKIETVKIDGTTDNNRPRKIIWLLPAVTFFFALVAISSFYIYEKNINSDLEVLVKEGETKALKGELLIAKETFEKVLQERPKHAVAAFNLEVVERGIVYEESLDAAARFAQKQQFDDGLRILDKLERELAKEEGPLIGRLKERSGLQTASLTVASVDNAQSEQTVDDLAKLLENIKGFKSEEAQRMEELLKEKIKDLAINKGQDYLRKNQFTEAEIEFNRALSYDPTNEKLLAYKGSVKTERMAFEKEEEKRLEEAFAIEARDEEFNRTKAIKPLTLEFSYDDENDELYVWGEVKNAGTKPVAEVEIHYSIIDVDGNELSSSLISIYKKILMPTEEGYFEETLSIPENVGDVKFVDFGWKVQ